MMKWKHGYIYIVLKEWVIEKDIRVTSYEKLLVSSTPAEMNTHISQGSSPAISEQLQWENFHHVVCKTQSHIDGI